MKHIGIVDITTVGACICANTIVSESAKRDPSNKHPEFTLHAFSFHHYKYLLLKRDWDSMADLILQSIHKLKLIGADFIIIPSNTPHYGFKKIKEKSPLPILNLIEICADECAINKYTKVAILGSKATMQEGLYDNYLKSKNIEAIIPDMTLCEEIHTLIMDQIIPSNINWDNVKSIGEKIKQIDCDAVLLGCTELPLVYDEIILNNKVIDTTRLLAVKALDFAIAAT